MSYAASWILPLPSKLSIFSVADSKWLTFRTYDANQGTTTAETNPSDLGPGPITDSSSIASVQLQNWTRVFGWVAAKNSQNVDENRLYMLSPVNQWIFKTATPSGNTSLTGISDGSTAWLYYADANNKIREQPYNGIGSGNQTGKLINSAMTLLAQTRLSACLNGGERIVAYQPDDGKLEVYNITQSSSMSLPNSFPQRKTPLALEAYKRGTERCMDLYYLSQDNPPVLHRARKLGDTKWVDSIPDGLQSPNSGTSLTATWLASQQAVVLVYKGDDGNMVVTVDNHN